MNNVTKMKIYKPAAEIYEAFADPDKIGGFWFSSSSERWEPGKTVTLRYEEYGAQGDIRIVEMIEHRKIMFQWVYGEDDWHTVTIALNAAEDGSTIVEVEEDGFQEGDPELLRSLLGNKEGWVYMLTCLKGYLESGIGNLRGSLVH